MGMLYPEECYAIRGAIYDVYSGLGAGFVEDVYQEALELELESRGIPFVAQKPLPVFYKGNALQKTFRADIVCYDKIILELKAVKTILPEHVAQLINYLKATKFRLGFLINFNHYPNADIKTFAN